ncbi:hypothetical protein LTR28_004253 [Elasticomyces elasticus]|nr:hypothetical protein LTR28_004253 [Elasticomyces elasticus]
MTTAQHLYKPTTPSALLSRPTIAPTPQSPTLQRNHATPRPQIPPPSTPRRHIHHAQTIKVVRGSRSDGIDAPSANKGLSKTARPATTRPMAMRKAPCGREGSDADEEQAVVPDLQLVSEPIPHPFPSFVSLSAQRKCPFYSDPPHPHPCEKAPLSNPSLSRPPPQFSPLPIVEKDHSKHGARNRVDLPQRSSK